MRFNLERPDMRKALAGTQQDIERAVTSGMRDASTELKERLRDDVVASGLGERLSRTWRGKVFPEVGESLDAAAFVWSKAPKLIDAFDRGVTIRSARGFWLAIPTPAAGARGRGPNGRASRITPGGWERRTGMRLRFVYRKRGPSLLVAAGADWTFAGVAAMPATADNATETVASLGNDAAERWSLRRDGAGGLALVAITGGAVAGSVAVAAPAAASRFAFAARRSGSGLALTINAGAVATATPGAMAPGAPTLIAPGATITGTGQWNAFVERLVVFSGGRNDAALQSLSTLATWGG